MGDTEALFAYSVSRLVPDNIQENSVRTLFVCCESESIARTFRPDDGGGGVWPDDISSLVVKLIGPADESLKRGIFGRYS